MERRIFTPRNGRWRWFWETHVQLTARRKRLASFRDAVWRLRDREQDERNRQRALERSRAQPEPR